MFEKIYKQTNNLQIYNNLNINNYVHAINGNFSTTSVVIVDIVQWL